MGVRRCLSEFSPMEGVATSSQEAEDAALRVVTLDGDTERYFGGGRNRCNRWCRSQFYCWRCHGYVPWCSDRGAPVWPAGNTLPEPVSYCTGLWSPLRHR